LCSKLAFPVAFITTFTRFIHLEGEGTHNTTYTYIS
jgi:hypothetical protein